MGLWDGRNRLTTSRTESSIGVRWTVSKTVDAPEIEAVGCEALRHQLGHRSYPTSPAHLVNKVISCSVNNNGDQEINFIKIRSL